MTEDRNSIAAPIEQLAKSKRLRPVWLWLGAVLYGAAAGAGGWIAGRVEHGQQIKDLTDEVKTLSGKVAVGNSQLADLKSAIASLRRELLGTDADGEGPGAVPGRIVQVDNQLVDIRRETVRVTAAVFGGEPEPVRARKRDVAERFVKAYDRQIDNGATPSAAAYTVISQVAIP